MRLVQLVACRLQLRRDKPDPDARAADEASIAAALTALHSMVVLTCERRLILRDQMSAEQRDATTH